VNISAILIGAVVTVFAFAIGEAIAPALIEGVKNILLEPFRIVSDTYRNRREVLHLLKVYAIWILIFASPFAIAWLIDRISK
jgi:ABC-type spermidine/putrescine transport system permease subunit I